ncbi:hypothetical protein [uncultured Oscillibacter sp.]|uniref:hypothetical protein n=1 Tax=uncultured Oscillibacter sp. TaxID=876091 RepID=UPI0025F30D10|nr:hypothetical protein [uncultured Oscillibacter sp.]
MIAICFARRQGLEKEIRYNSVSISMMILIYYRFKAGVCRLENHKPLANRSRIYAYAGGDTVLYHHDWHLSFLFRRKGGAAVSLRCFPAAHKDTL